MVAHSGLPSLPCNPPTPCHHLPTQATTEMATCRPSMYQVISELQVIPKNRQTTPKGLTSHACMYTPAHIHLTLAHMRFAPAHTPVLAHCSRYNLSGIRVLSTLFQLTFNFLPRAGRGAWGGTPLHSCKNHTIESRCVSFW
jgi:hypothetical protein